jgi:hypothetical protein
MDVDQTVDAAKAKWGYPAWYDWKVAPPWDEISARLNSLLRRGATGINIYDAGSTNDNGCEVVIVDGELNATEASNAFTAWMEIWWEVVDEDHGFDWRTQPEPFRVP